MSPIVSVIVPVYNTEAYLVDCLESILRQSLSDIEVIVVDDGSSDGSQGILQRYVTADERVRLLSNDRADRGPGRARNIGIAACRGRYIAFVDSDDRIESTMLEKLVAAAERHDATIAMCMIRTFDDDRGPHEVNCGFDRTIPSRFDGHTFTWQDLGEGLFAIRFVAWNKIYRRELLAAQEVRFSEDRFYEDMMFSFTALLTAPSLTFVREPLYLNRRDRPGATTFEQGDRVFDAIASLGELEQLLSTDPTFSLLDVRFRSWRFRRLLDWLPKNDAAHMPSFYRELQLAARALDEPARRLLTEHEKEARSVIAAAELPDFLVWYVWKLQNQRVQQTRTIRELQATVKQRRTASVPATSAQAGGESSPGVRLEQLSRWHPRRMIQGVRWRVRGLRRGWSLFRRSDRGGGPTSERPAARGVQDAPREPKWKVAYQRESKANLYDGVDLLRQMAVERLHRTSVDRIRSKVSAGEPIRVAFLVCDRTRWNADSLWSELQCDRHFTPRIVLLGPAGPREASTAVQVYGLEREFFREIDPEMIELYSVEDGTTKPVEELDLDVVFLEKPWGMQQLPRRLAGRALTAYLHYGFMLMGNHSQHYNIAPFHSYLWAYFAQTEYHRRIHLDHDPSAYERVVAAGYPKLDVYAEPPDESVAGWEHHSGGGGKRIIYAPHHSVMERSLRMSTFPWSGPLVSEMIDAYAELSWAYKPHPDLADRVVMSGQMTREEYADYLASWEERPNAFIYDSGHYFDLFRTSDVLVTCSGSFLAEYLPTGKPIIWLVTPDAVELNDFGERLATGFYRAESPEELQGVFNQVVLQGHDPLAPVREQLIAELFPRGRRSADAIMQHLRGELIPPAAAASR